MDSSGCCTAFLNEPDQLFDSAIIPSRRFVVGCERSGTTLLSVLLDRHSQLAMTPETHFFLEMLPHKNPCRLATHSELLNRFLASPRARDLNLDRDALRLRFESLSPTYMGLFSAVMDEYARARHKRWAGEKTPFHLWKAPLILQWFPDARIVNLVRDGRDVVYSILDAPWTIQRSIRHHATEWVKAVHFGLSLQKRYPSSVLTVRFEDLLREPRSVLSRIDHFFGLPFEESQLDEQRPTGVVPDRVKDFKARATQRLDVSRIGRWADRATPDERFIMNSIMGPTLQELGYPDTALPPVAAATRVIHGIATAAYRARIQRTWHKVIGRNLPSARALRKQRKAAGYEPQR